VSSRALRGEGVKHRLGVVGMRIMVFVVCCLIWVNLALAAPGMIIAPRVEAHAAPSEEAIVIAELLGGDPICIANETHDVGVSHPGWLAIRRPSGIGYVRSEAVDLASNSPAAARLCSDWEAAAPASAQPSSNSSSAEDTTAAEPGAFVTPHPMRISLGIGTGAAWLTQQTAAQHHIGGNGPTITFALGLTIYDVFEISGSGGSTFPSDNASFSQDVMSMLGGGDSSLAQSHLEVHRWSIAAGLRTPFFALRRSTTGAFSAAAFAGVGWSSIHGDRSIPDCSDCRVDDLNMAGGTFWRAGFDLATESLGPRIPLTYSVSLAYQRYRAGAGLTQEIGISLNVLFL
jgi:hypothetical protein